MLLQNKSLEPFAKKENTNFACNIYISLTNIVPKCYHLIGQFAEDVINGESFFSEKNEDSIPVLL